MIIGYSAPAAEDPDAYKIHAYNWAYSRERKTVTSSNRVIGSFMLKNVSDKNLNEVAVTLTYTTGIGEQVIAPLSQKLGALKAGEARKVSLTGDFVPAFSAYTLVVEYGGGKEEWFSNSDVGQPQPKNGQPLKGTASVVVLGRELAPDRTGKLAGTVRVKNEGTIEAKNVRISIAFFDTKKNRIKDWAEKLGSGTLAGGAEENITFTVAGAPRNYAAYELRVGCDDTSAETSLSGGEFTKIEDVEFAKFSFKRPDAKKEDLLVAAQVRNGLQTPADKIKLTLVFLGVKKKELKRYTFEVPGEVRAGEIKPVQFAIPAVPPYDGFEQLIDYNKIDPAAAAAPAGQQGQRRGGGGARKNPAAKFQNLKDIEIIFTESVDNEDKSVSLAGALRNGKDVRIKDVAITIEFAKTGGGLLATAEKTLTDTIKPGEERNFVVQAPKAAGYESYSFKFKYAEAGK